MKNQLKCIRISAVSKGSKTSRIKALLTLFIFAATGVFAQQDAMYSQYMFNGLAINPAYAGTRNVLSATGLFRRQWAQLSPHGFGRAR